MNTRILVLSIAVFFACKGPGNRAPQSELSGDSSAAPRLADKNSSAATTADGGPASGAVASSGGTKKTSTKIAVARTERPGVESGRELPDLAKLSSDASASSLRSGRYLGYLNMPGAKLSFPLVVTLIPVRESRGHGKYQAILRLQNESFGSYEYDGEHFSKVDYDPKTGQLAFDSSSSRIRVPEAHGEGESLNGILEFRTHTEDGSESWLQGTFSAKWQSTDDTTVPTPLLSAGHSISKDLRGVYYGVCKGASDVAEGGQGRRSELRVEIQKNDRVDAESGLPPFPAWSVAIRSTGVGRVRGGFGARGYFDIATGRLVMKAKNGGLGKPSSFVCERQGESLKCSDGCVYATLPPEGRQAGATRGIGTYVSQPRKFNVGLDSNRMPQKRANKKLQADKLAGEYYGFLHHELLDRYQLVRLKINVKKQRRQNEDWTFLGGSSALFFGEKGHEEFIVYPYKPRRYVPQRRTFVFDGPGESLFTVTKWRKNGIEGVWYSKSFGRIGTVQTTRNAVPKIAKAARFIEGIGGEYSQLGVGFQIASRSAVSDAPLALYPNRVLGWIMRPGLDQQRKFAIAGGRYDFYLGIVDLEVENGVQALATIQGQSMQIYLPTDLVVEQPTGIGASAQKYIKIEGKKSSALSLRFDEVEKVMRLEDKGVIKVAPTDIPSVIESLTRDVQ